MYLEYIKDLSLTSFHNMRDIEKNPQVRRMCRRALLEKPTITKKT